VANSIGITLRQDDPEVEPGRTFLRSLVGTNLALPDPEEARRTIDELGSSLAPSVHQAAKICAHAAGEAVAIIDVLLHRVATLEDRTAGDIWLEVTADVDRRRYELAHQDPPDLNL
jgi:hypothetical protein